MTIRDVDGGGFYSDVTKSYYGTEAAAVEAEAAYNKARYAPPPPTTTTSGREIDYGVVTPPPPTTTTSGREIDYGVVETPVSPPPATTPTGREIDYGVVEPVVEPAPTITPTGREIDYGEVVVAPPIYNDPIIYNNPTPEREAAITESLLNIYDAEAAAAIIKYDETISKQQSIIDDAMGTDFDPTDMSAAVDNLTQLQLGRASLEQTRGDLSTFRVQLDYFKRLIRGKTTDKTPEWMLYGAGSMKIKEEKVEGNVFTFIPGTFSSVSTPQQGYVITSPIGWNIDIPTTMYKGGIPSPVKGARPGSIGAEWQRSVNAAIENMENFFSGVTLKVVEAGARAASASQTYKVGGDNTRAGFAAGMTVLAGTAHGAFDAATFIIRPKLIGQTMESLYNLAAHQSARDAAVRQVAEAPLYTAGYFAGTLLGGEVQSQSVSRIQKVYSKTAPKIPGLRDIYYAQTIGRKVSTMPEFSISNNLALEYTGAGGNPTLGALKYWRQGKIVVGSGGSLAENAVITTVKKLGSKLMQTTTPLATTERFLKMKGVDTSPYGGLSMSAGEKTISGTLRSYVKLAKMRGVNTEPYGGLFTSTRGELSARGFSSATRKFFSMPGVNTDPYGGLTTQAGHTPSSVYIKFLKTKGKDVDLNATTMQQRVKAVEKGDIWKTFDPKKGANRGFSRIDSGVVGRVTTRYERNLTAFMQNTFREKPPIVDSTPGLGFAKAVNVAKTIPVNRRRRLPNPYYPEPPEEDEVELVPVDSKLFSAAARKVSINLKNRPSDSMKELVRVSRKPIMDNRIRLPSDFMFKDRRIIKPKTDPKSDDVSMIRVGEKERRRFDIILKSNFEQLTEPREKEISWAALRQKQILAGAEPMKKRLDVKAKKKKKKSKQRGRNTNIYELRHDPTVAPEKLLKRMLI